MAISARIERAATGRYFRHMWREGRVIVPADGWYEWTGEEGRKQPWHQLPCLGV
jgi:putative SOS response-associated peptidase YedK